MHLYLALLKQYYKIDAEVDNKIDPTGDFVLTFGIDTNIFVLPLFFLCQIVLHFKSHYLPDLHLWVPTAEHYSS